MKRLRYWVLVLAAITVLVIGFFSVGIKIFIKYHGVRTNAFVIKIPNSCDKYNHITLLIDSAFYEVGISRSDCKNAVYKVGDIVVVLKSDLFDEVIWPENQFEYLPIIFILLAIIGYFSINSNLKEIRIGKNPVTSKSDSS